MINDTCALWFHVYYIYPIFLSHSNKYHIKNPSLYNKNFFKNKLQRTTLYLLFVDPTNPIPWSKCQPPVILIFRCTHDFASQKKANSEHGHGYGNACRFGVCINQLFYLLFSNIYLFILRIYLLDINCILYIIRHKNYQMVIYIVPINLN